MKNRLVIESEAARAELKKATRMDELDYQLLILESGCRFLEHIVRPNEFLNEQDARAYREHLGAVGFWEWFVYRFRCMELEVAKQWAGPESLVAIQPAEYKRQRLIEEAEGILFYRKHLDSFEVWLKLLEDKRFMRKQQLQHAH